MNTCTHACGSPEHVFSRRRFLARIGAGAVGALGFGALTQPAAAAELARAQKRVLLIFLHGGASQLETWDPKPGTDTGGPFRAIPTTVPGIHVGELLPYTARQMHRLALVRGVNTHEDDHGKGQYLMETGRKQEPAMVYPHLGAAMAKLLGADRHELPGFIHIQPGGSGFNKQDAAFLGPRYASVGLGNGQPPANLLRPASLSETGDRERNALRAAADHRFLQHRHTAATQAYLESYDQAARLMERREVFDSSREPLATVERYGTHDFGRHCLLARRLLEAGVTFVKITHSNYDTHHENFDFHIQRLGEFDRPFAKLIDDLAQRGMLESTLVVVMSEFGRTPNINHLDGRDHWSKAWSVALAGCGIKPGAVVGKTDARGTAVVDREVGAGDLFHTYFRAVGLDPKKRYYVHQQPIAMTDQKSSAIKELLA